MPLPPLPPFKLARPKYASPPIGDAAKRNPEEMNTVARAETNLFATKVSVRARLQPCRKGLATQGF